MWPSLVFNRLWSEFGSVDQFAALFLTSLVPTHGLLWTYSNLKNIVVEARTQPVDL